MDLMTPGFQFIVFLDFWLARSLRHRLNKFFWLILFRFSEAGGWQFEGLILHLQRQYVLGSDCSLLKCFRAQHFVFFGKVGRLWLFALGLENPKQDTISDSEIFVQAKGIAALRLSREIINSSLAQRKRLDAQLMLSAG